MRFLVIILCCLLMVSACQSTEPVEVSELPEGDAARGAELFQQVINGAPSCSTCHRITDEASTGPGLAGFSEVAGERVPGTSAFDYTHQSIIQPARYIVSGYSNLMYSGYATRLSGQQIADLIAYLLTL